MYKCNPCHVGQLIQSYRLCPRFEQDISARREKRAKTQTSPGRQGTGKLAIKYKEEQCGSAMALV